MKGGWHEEPKRRRGNTGLHCCSIRKQGRVLISVLQTLLLVLMITHPQLLGFIRSCLADKLDQ